MHVVIYLMSHREYLRRARTALYFSNVFTRKGLALAHLPKCPLRRDNPWGPHAGLKFEVVPSNRPCFER